MVALLHRQSGILLRLAAVTVTSLSCGAATPIPSISTIAISPDNGVSLPSDVLFPDRPPVYAVVKVDQPPKLDGTLDDGCWHLAKPIGRFYLDSGEGLLPYDTIARMVRDDTYLYLAVDCRHPKISDVPVRKGARDAVRGSGETIELFLHADCGSPDYVQVIFDMSGAFSDLYAGQPTWNGDITAATDVGGAGWRLEAKMRMADLAVGGKADPFCWGANIARNSDSDSASWARLVGSYQQPDRFGLLTFSKASLAVDDLAVGIFADPEEGAAKLPVHLGLRNTADRAAELHISYTLLSASSAESPLRVVLDHTLPAFGIIDLPAQLDAKGATQLQVRVSVGMSREPAFEASLPVRYMQADSDNLLTPQLAVAIRPLSSVVLDKGQAVIDLMAKSLQPAQTQAKGTLRLVRRQDSEIIWQCPVELHLPGFTLGVQRVNLPVNQMPPGRYRIEWQLDDAAEAGIVRANLEYSPMDLAQMASLLKPATVQDLLPKLHCPLPKDMADQALVQVRIDRLAERVQAELARKDPILTAKIAAAYRQLLEVVDPLRSGKGYSSAQRGWFEAAFYSPVDGSAQPYALFVPRDYDGDSRKRYPLVVHLHGSGGSHTRDIGMILDVSDAFILNVLGRGPTYGYREISADEVVREIQEVMSRYRIDPDAVHLRGHSMGGGGTFLVGSTYPDLFATARPLCGYSSGMPVEQMVSLPTFVHHGLADRGIDPLCSAVAVARMQQVSCPVQLYLHPGVGHNVGPAANKVARWDTFKDIRRDLQPRTVVLTGGIPALKKAYWLAILRYNDVHEEASLRATFVQQNHLVLDAANVAWLKITLPCKWVDPQKVVQISDAAGYRWTELTPGEAKAIYVHITDGKLEAATEPAIDFEDPGVYTDGGVPFMFWLGRPLRVVYGTAGSAEQTAATEELLSQLRRWSWLGGKEMETGGLPALKDAEVDEQTLKTCDLILLGTPQDNALLAKMAESLPVRYSDGKVSVDGEPSLSWPADDVLFSLYYRNPLSPQQRIWWFGGSHDRKTLQATVDISRYGTFGRLAPELIVLDRQSLQVVAIAHIQAEWNLARAEPTGPVASVWTSPAQLAREYAQAMRDAFGADISVVEPFYSADSFAWNRLTAGDLMRALPSRELIMVSLQGSELQHWRETYTIRGNNTAKADDIPWAGVDPQALEADSIYDVLLQPDMAMADSMQRSGISLARARVVPAPQVQIAKNRFLRNKGLLPGAAAPDPARAADGSTVSDRQSSR